MRGSLAEAVTAVMTQRLEDGTAVPCAAEKRQRHAEAWATSFLVGAPLPCDVSSVLIFLLELATGLGRMARVLDAEIDSYVVIRLESLLASDLYY